MKVRKSFQANGLNQECQTTARIKDLLAMNEQSPTLSGYPLQTMNIDKYRVSNKIYFDAAYAQLLLTYAHAREKARTGPQVRASVMTDLYPTSSYVVGLVEGRLLAITHPHSGADEVYSCSFMGSSMK